VAGESEFFRQRFDGNARDISEVKLSHTLGSTSAVFDDPNLVSAGGLVPVLALADAAGLRDLADEHLTVPTDKGANPGLKVASLVGGMVAGADSIDDMALLRHGGMSRIFTRAYAPSTLGSFLRAFTFGHIRQLDAVASRLPLALAKLTSMLNTGAATGADAESEGSGQYAHDKSTDSFNGRRSLQEPMRDRLLEDGEVVLDDLGPPPSEEVDLPRCQCRAAA
jgi:hypothetical protein